MCWVYLHYILWRCRSVRHGLERRLWQLAPLFSTLPVSRAAANHGTKEQPRNKSEGGCGCDETLVFKQLFLISSRSWTTGISGRYLALTNSLATSTDSIQGSPVLAAEYTVSLHGFSQAGRVMPLLLFFPHLEDVFADASDSFLKNPFEIVKGIEAQTNAPQRRGPRNAPTEIWEYLECH